MVGQISIWQETYKLLKSLIGVCFSDLWHELARALAYA
jgi:hypothetical protein